MEYKMVCPQCNGKLRIVDTISDNVYTYRERRCLSCGKKLCTREEKINYYDGRRTINRLRTEKKNINKLRKQKEIEEHQNECNECVECD